jgi:uncharacterized membrane protein (UPF0127 family)
MAWVKIVRRQDGVVIADRARVADDFFSRLKGLIGKDRFESGEGLLFPRCASIHMWFMGFSIDVLFLSKTDSGWDILSVHPGLNPWKLLPVGHFRADDALELPAGTVERFRIRSGEALCIAS